jgi:dihydroorotate dehydrogenase electron transfer subunit
MKYFTVSKNIKEAENVNTLEFYDDIRITPGQFIMAWVPGINEIPLSFSSIEYPKSITVKVYGEASAKIASMTTGDRLFYEGPYGNGFNTITGKKLVIGAGSGIAPLIPLVDHNTTGIISGKTAGDIILSSKFNPELLITVTDDGTAGKKGFATEAMKEIDVESFDMIYVCGPEVMLKAVFDYVKNMNVEIQFSLERSMKCGIGICDSCSINGYQVCHDGPVFTVEQLKKMDEFGRTKLTYSGKRVFF